MKTTTKLPALLLIISMMFASSTFANKKSINFEDEAYVDDIPFNTADVVANYNYNQTTSVIYEMDNEQYIDDIPFSTQYVVEAIAYNNAVSEVFEMVDEAYVDDIPFDTYSVVSECLAENSCVALKK